MRTIVNNHNRAASPIRARSPASHDRKRTGGETRLMILVLLGFGLVHVIGAILIQRASTERGDPPLILASHTD
jgi:hypothetical protein